MKKKHLEYLKEDANSDYKKAKAKMEKVMSQLHMKIEKHAMSQKKKPMDYGYVGDMNHITTLLSDMVNFLNV